jgi:outer membrane protein assembly factor BamB
MATLLVLPACSSLQSSANRRELVIERDWTRSTLKEDISFGYRRMNRMSPIVLKDVVIQGNAVDGVATYQRKSGNLLWRLNIRNGVEGGAELVGSRLYFGASDGQFYCVDVTNGNVLWTFAVNAETLAPPTVSDGVVYFESGADLVYALDAASGKQLWVYNRQTTTTISVRASTRPTVVGNDVYVGFSDGYVVALRKHDGTLIWDRKIGGKGRFHDVDSTPIYDHGLLYVASFDESLHAIRAETGEEVWQTSDGGYTAVTIEEERLYFSTSDGWIQCIDKNSGKIIWTQKVKHGIGSRPTLLKGYLLFGESEGPLMIVDSRTGHYVTSFSPGLGLVSQAAIWSDSDGSDIYFISNSANLFALKIGFISPADRLPWQQQ